MRLLSIRWVFTAAVALAAVSLYSNSVQTHAAEKAASGKTGATKTSTTPAAQTPPAVAAPFTNKFLSTFSVDNPRDPFHPQAKRKTSSTPVLTGPQSESEQPQVVAAISAGFQGIYGSGDERLLMVHGVLMPENRETTIVVPVGGQPRRLKVKAVKIYRNTAELQVEGLSQTIAVPRAQK
jgi:hypothetical protein